MFVRNSNMLSGGKNKSTNGNNNNSNERVELFSTDSEMDSFFKENETIVNMNSKYNNSNDNMSSSTSPNKTDDNTMNENVDDDEFDRIVSEAQRLAFFKNIYLYLFEILNIYVTLLL